MSDAALLLKAAAEGDESAWAGLEALFGPRMWAVARACGLGEADAADAVQGAWLRLLESLDRIREPSCVGAWLVTTARREAIQLLRRGPTTFPAFTPPAHPSPESTLLEADSVRLLWQQVTDLPEPCRTLLKLLATQAGPRQVAVRMGIPPGSVGPTRARCLQKLRTRISLEEKVQ
ncbi:sigma-70 family RNA polymerase sigma factor [Nonomuraea sp. NPDC050310]|uniref:RNA polymerase sigma factor n=1 Tax=unclassified Nonomuraea TaxID=2593643 RepID=UPI0033F5C104